MAEVDGVGLSRSGPVLLHGFTGSSAAWGDGLVDALAGALGPPVLVDLPGHRGEPWTPGPDALADTIDAITEAAPERFDLVGYSMGGRIALHVAVRHPERVRRLVLESASPGLADPAERAERRTADESLARRIEDEGVVSFVEAWERRPLFETEATLPPDVRERRRAVRLSHDPRGLGAALRHLGTGALPPLWEALPVLSVPTLVLVGALDRKFVALGERMVALLADARLRVVAGAGHAVHLERPDAWVEAVVGHLASG